MKTRVMSLMVVAALVIGAASMAHADTYDLTVTNGWAPSGVTYATVTIVTNGGTLYDGSSTCGSDICIEFSAVSGYQFFGNDSGAGAVGWNTDLTPGEDFTASIDSCVANGGASCTYDSDGAHFDGFGDFNQNVYGGTGSSTGFNDVVINIAGSGLTLSDFINGSTGGNGDSANLFAAHISPYPNPNGLCTGFTANTGARQPSSYDSNLAQCGGSQVPEPGSLMLFGTGLLGIAGFLRRKLLS